MSDALSVIRSLDGPLRVSEAERRYGIKPSELYALEARGEVERLARGMFVAAGRPPLVQPDFAIVCQRAPRAVVCLVSALVFHEMTDERPYWIDLAVRRGDYRPNAAWPPLRSHSFSPASHASGIETYTIDGVDVKIYSREKTLADCFKFRHRIGKDVMLDALHQYCAGRRRVGELMRQARICRVAKVIEPYLETAL